MGDTPTKLHAEQSCATVPTSKDVCSMSMKRPGIFAILQNIAISFLARSFTDITGQALPERIRERKGLEADIVPLDIGAEPIVREVIRVSCR